MDIEIDWSDSPDVEQVPGRVSGQWVVKDTRILADGVVVNSDDYTPDEIATEIFPALASRGRGGSSLMPEPTRRPFMSEVVD